MAINIEKGQILQLLTSNGDVPKWMGKKISIGMDPPPPKKGKEDIETKISKLCILLKNKNNMYKLLILLLMGF